MASAFIWTNHWLSLSKEAQCPCETLLSTPLVEKFKSLYSSQSCSIVVARKHVVSWQLKRCSTSQHGDVGQKSVTCLQRFLFNSERETKIFQSLDMTATFFVLEKGQWSAGHGAARPKYLHRWLDSYESIINLDYGNRVASLSGLKMTYYVSVFFLSSSRYFGLKCK